MLRSRDRKSPKAKKPEPKNPFVRFLKNWVMPLALAVAILTPIRSAIADWNDVPSGSMRPTILEGDRIWVNKLAYGLRVPFTQSWLARWDSPARGEIVTLASPRDGTRLVKRVVGLPGDRLEMRGNRLLINGEPVTYDLVQRDLVEELPGGQHVRAAIAMERLPGRPHPITLTTGLASPSTFRELVVPEGQYLVMGDNRDQSADSRSFGFVKESSIYGRSSYVALSFDPENLYAPRLDRWFTRMP